MVVLFGFDTWILARETELWYVMVVADGSNMSKSVGDVSRHAGTSGVTIVHLVRWTSSVE